MEQQNKNPRFPEQDEPNKITGTNEENKSSSQEQPAKMKSEPKGSDKNESTHLTDRSGEEEKEDYINTDERKRDLDRNGL
jgi:hypothetical protein